MTGLVQRMRVHLESQLDMYRSMNALQRQLLRELDHSDGMQKVLDLLEEKNQHLDKLRKNQKQAAPLLEAWRQQKSELPESDEVKNVDELINTMESLALAMRNQDEEMIRRFERIAVSPADKESRDKHSRNMLNAFRALR
ncbi:MAG: hypothetical protein GX801_07660 [Fibrobacter sp.]|nr:hypothetical protein [Fibrobacter sp.]